ATSTSRCRWWCRSSRTNAAASCCASSPSSTPRMCARASSNRRSRRRRMVRKKGRAAYMISAVAEQYGIHPQTLRLYEREGLLKPSRTEGNTRLYTDEDLERLEFILNLARDLGVNIAGIAIILQMRERMEEMNRQMQSFVEYVRSEMLTRFQQGVPVSGAAIVPIKRPVGVPPRVVNSKKS